MSHLSSIPEAALVHVLASMIVLLCLIGKCVGTINYLEHHYVALRVDN